MLRLHPVLLAGGAGARLWPLSDRTCPKPFIDLLGEGPPVSHVARLVSDPETFEPPIVAAAKEHRGLVEDSLQSFGPSTPKVMLEPLPRGTAAAAAGAAALIVRSTPDAMMLLLPTDFSIDDPASFRKTLSDAAAAARHSTIVLFGVSPDRASSAFGYIRAGEALSGAQATRSVSGFLEKPDRETAMRLVEEGECLWNTGIVLAPASLFLEELARFEPDLVAHAHGAADRASVEGSAFLLDAESFSRCRAASIDRALMERSERLAVMPLECGWRDIGSWTALARASVPDTDGNTLLGDVVAAGTSGSYIRTSGPRVVALGVKDLVVVATGDAILVLHKDRDQDLGSIAAGLAAGAG